MIEFWNSLAYTTKFSSLAFIITLAASFLSMGIFGALLYYPVSFLFSAFPNINDWRGDWVWPATIVVGMAWSFGFIFGGVAWHFLSKSISSVVFLRMIYGIILWAWAALLWYFMIYNNVSPK